MTLNDLEAFTREYIVAALWTESIGEDFANQRKTAHGEDFAPDTNLLGFGFGIGDLDSTARANVNASCESFVRTNLADLRELDAAQCGHDFWLTRNHHGAGFWDRGYGEVGVRLTNAAHSYGESSLYVGDDGRIYEQG